MEISISQLKEEYKDYCANNVADNSENNAQSSVSEKTVYEASPDVEYIPLEQNSDDISLFSDVDKFDSFLDEKYNYNLDNSTMKTDDILNLEFQNGQFVEKNDNEESDKNSDEIKLPLVGILNDLLTNEQVKCIIDSDGNGNLAQGEVKAFLKAIEELDGQKGDISVRDILSGAKEIKNIDLSKYMEDEKTQDINSENEQGINSLLKPSENNSSSNTPIIQNNPANSASAVNMPNISLTKKPKNEKTTNNINDFQKQKSTKENELKKAQEDYNKVFSGENSKVKDAKEKYDTSKSNYKNLLLNEDGLTSEEKQRLENALDKVENASQLTDKAEIALQNAENELFNEKNIISKHQASLDELKSALNDSNSNNTSTAELKNKINKIEKTLLDENSKLKDLTQKRDNAKKELTLQKNELKNAQKEKNALENELIVNNDKVSPELKSAVKEYNNDEKNLQTVKESEASSAKNTITKTQKDLNEINNQINAQNAEQIKQKFKTSNLNQSQVFGNNNQYDGLINKYAKTYGVDPLLVKCIIMQESGFNERACSYVGAGGLMQLMPETASDLGVTNVYNPEDNLNGGIKLISRLLKKYNGNVSFALAAYNAGEGNVDKYGGIPPFSETQNYVKAITGNYNKLKA